MCFKKYVTQTAGSTIKALVEPISAVVHFSTRHVRQDDLNFFSSHFLEGLLSIEVNLGTPWTKDSSREIIPGCYTWRMWWPPKSPRKEMTYPGNICITNAICDTLWYFFIAILSIRCTNIAFKALKELITYEVEVITPDSTRSGQAEFLSVLAFEPQTSNSDIHSYFYFNHTECNI